MLIFGTSFGLYGDADVMELNDCPLSTQCLTQ